MGSTAMDVSVRKYYTILLDREEWSLGYILHRQIPIFIKHILH